MFDFTRATLSQHSQDMRQFIDCRAAQLPSGERVLDVHNSSGLTLTLLPDRGMDIYSAHYKGAPLTWISQGSPHRADAGSSWLRQFNGGLLTTCGMTHAGPPETDPQTGERRDIHGHYTRLSARLTHCEGAWDADDRYTLTLRAAVAQARLFGEQLTLTRTIRVRLGEPALHISDAVTNTGDQPAPLMLLYHFNVGYPLVREGARLIVPSHAVHPRDDAARAGLDTWAHYRGAVAGYAEQVFYHHLRAHDGQTQVLLTNGDIGLALGWDARTAPYFTQWKNTRQGVYVCGIEPGNCVPEGQNAARANGRLIELAPGEQAQFSHTLRVHEGECAISAAAERIAWLGEHGAPLDGVRL